MPPRIKNSLGSTSEVRTDLRIGELVMPIYYIELCNNIDLEEMSTSLDKGSICVVLEFNDNVHGWLMCRILAPNGVDGWVSRPHLLSM